AIIGGGILGLAVARELLARRPDLREDLYKKPFHPYTEALLSAIPEPDPNDQKERIHLAGELPSPINPPKGCRFCTRCPYVKNLCPEKYPPMKFFDNRQVACHFVDETGFCGTH
ncbi:MAG: oligopeptide/dipeptide ABC transporter ATP-binding protein, partial [Selenomonadaceae bacterium]